MVRDYAIVLALLSFTLCACSSRWTVRIGDEANANLRSRLEMGLQGEARLSVERAEYSLAAEDLVEQRADLMRRFAEAVAADPSKSRVLSDAERWNASPYVVGDRGMVASVVPQRYSEFSPVGWLRVDRYALPGQDAARVYQLSYSEEDESREDVAVVWSTSELELAWARLVAGARDGTREYHIWLSDRQGSSQ